jgi:hypothetical protein
VIGKIGKKEKESLMRVDKATGFFDLQMATSTSLVEDSHI